MEADEMIALGMINASPGMDPKKQGDEQPEPLALRTDDPRDVPAHVGAVYTWAAHEFADTGKELIDLSTVPGLEAGDRFTIRAGDEGQSPVVEVHKHGASLPAVMDESEIINYEVVPERKIKEVIAEMETRYKSLVIADMKDKPGADAVQRAKVHTKEVIAQLKARRVDNKAGILEWGRKVDAAAVELITPLLAIRDHLEKEQERIAAEKEVEAEKRRAEAAQALQVRIDALAAVGGKANVALLTVMSKKAFDAYLEEATEAHKAAEAARVAREAQAEADAVAARLAADAKADQAAKQAELNRQAADLKAKQDELDRQKAEQDKVDAAAKAVEAERLRVLEEEKAKQAREDARIKREAEIAAAAPDAEKLTVYAEGLRNLTVPVMSTEAGRAAAVEIMSARDALEKFIRAKVSHLTAA